MLLVLYSDGTDVWDTHDVSRPFQNIAIVSCIDCYLPCKRLQHKKYFVVDFITPQPTCSPHILPFRALTLFFYSNVSIKVNFLFYYQFL